MICSFGDKIWEADLAKMELRRENNSGIQFL